MVLSMMIVRAIQKLIDKQLFMTKLAVGLFGKSSHKMRLIDNFMKIRPR